jgi:hypothetical protein
MTGIQHWVAFLVLGNFTTTIAMADSSGNSNDLHRSSLTSIRPSIYEHIEEHGRTYHAYKSGSLFTPL